MPDTIAPSPTGAAQDTADGAAGDLYDCPGCGAEVGFPAGQLSRLCAFCETPLVRSPDQEREPIDAVAPFELDRRQAAGRLGRFLQDCRWAPEEVRNAGRPEELKAVLVPFWCYDAVARSDYDAQVGIWWYETQTYTTTVNGKTQTRTRQVRRTEWHRVSGSHAMTYTDHLVSGSRGLPEAEANELEPFDVGQALPFDPSMLAGQVSEVPSVDHDEARRVAAEELQHKEQAAIKRFLPGDECRSVSNSTGVDVDRVRLVMLPVWVATYRHKDAVFRLLINGQTGEVVGKVPRSWVKIALVVAVVLGALFAMLVCAGGLTGAVALLQQHI